MGNGYLGGFGGGAGRVKEITSAQREQAELQEGAVPTPERWQWIIRTSGYSLRQWWT